MDKGTLYLIATPIGNLEDITLRGINTLKQVDVIAAEDTRHTLKLLNHLQISKPMISYHRHNEEVKSKELIDRLLNGESIGLVTDAGTPGISDPGEEIVKEAIKNSIKIVPVPGACAAINALITSGLSTKEFIFYGFLPLNKKLRSKKFEDIARQKKTIIIYEAPHRIKETLEEIKERFGNIYVVLAKEITKIHESFIRGAIEEVLEQVNEPKGEFIILFEISGITEKEEEENNIKKLSLEEQYKFYEEQGLSKKDIIKTMAKLNGVHKDIIYKKFID